MTAIRPWMAATFVLAIVAPGTTRAGGGSPAEELQAASAGAARVLPVPSDDDAWARLEVLPPPTDAPPPAEAGDSVASSGQAGHDTPRFLTRRAGGAGSGESTSARAVRPGPRSAEWLRTSLSLGGVVALIVLLAWGYRVVTGGARLATTFRGRRPGLIEVVARTVLAPRHSLCLVRIGPRLVLLGLSADAIRALDVIDDADLTARLLGQMQRRRADSETAEFARCLTGQARAYESNAGTASRSGAESGDAQIIKLTRRLQGAIQRLGAAGQR
jgi:flagellar biogenesis protein FliO